VPTRANASSASPVRPNARALAQLTMAFEPNQGQTDPQVKFLAHGRGYGLFLTTDQAALSLQPMPGVRHVVRMSLKDANRFPNVTGNDELPGKSNYLIGNDPSKWHRNVPQFARV